MDANAREAAGFFLYRLNKSGSAEFLLLRSAEHGGWGVPKGHRDAKDCDLFAAAARELTEETGLADVLVHSGFRAKIRYQAQRKGKGEAYSKEVSYFLARYSDGKVALSDEHDAEGWFEEAKTRTLLKFANLLEVFDNACDYLKTHCNVKRGKDVV